MTKSHKFFYSFLDTSKGLTNDKIRTMLFNYVKLDKWIQDAETELQHIRDNISLHYEVGTSTISDMPHGTGVSDNTFQAVVKIDKLKEVYVKRSNKLAESIDKCYQEKELIEWLMPQLKPIHQNIIELRYFQRMKWKDILAQDKEQRIQATFDREHKLLFNEIRRLLQNKKEGL